MAFGLGFNKAKTLAAAEKYVMQGKIPAAIQEYQKILEHEPRDLVIINTVGDLYLRLSKTEDALACFYKLGEAYVEDGFVRNGIAVYKKIVRAQPTAIDAMMRLADLYAMQGQHNEARNYLNQAVEHYQNQGDVSKCVELFEKLLMMDPDNLGVKARLAGLYDQAGRKDEAAYMFFSAAEGYADRANPTEAEKILKKAREAGLQTPDVIVLEARIQIDSGRAAEAIATLNRIPDRDANKAALNLLYHAHIASSDLDQAGAVALTLFERFDDFAGLEQVCAMMLDRGETGVAVDIYARALDRLIAQHNTQPLLDGLKHILASDPRHVPARELLCQAYEKTGQTGELIDSCEQLADTLVQREDYEAARQVYVKLTQLEPNNPENRRKLQQIDHHLGRETSMDSLAAEVSSAPAVAADFLPDLSAHGAPAAAPVLDPASQAILDEALNDAELQRSYRQTDRAIAILQEALLKLPGNTRLSTELLALCEQTDKWDLAASCCDELATACTALGDGEGVARYQGLLSKYRALAAAAAPAVAEFAVPTTDALPSFTVEEQTPAAEELTVPTVAPMAMHVEQVAAEDQGVREVDLSGEWESLMAVEEKATASAPAGVPVQAPEVPESADGLAEEVGFYLQTGMLSEASLSLEKLRAAAPNDPRLADLQAKVEQAILGGGVTVSEPAMEVVEQGDTVAEIALPTMEAEPYTPAEAPPVVEAPPLEIPQPEVAPPVLEVSPPAIEEPAELTLEEAPLPAVETAHEEEFALELEHAHHAPEPAAAAADSGGHFELSLEMEEPAAEPVAPAATAHAEPAGMGLDDLVGSLEDEISGIAAQAPPAPPKPIPPKAPPAKAASPPAKPTKPAAAGKAAAGGGLAEMFDEFKAEMEQDQAVESDIENHYNMGVAFKEMGLFDEAIGEFQKAFHGAERLPSHPNFVPICSLLAHCFLEKNLPDLAVQWLTTALKAEGLDRESEMAVRYEIGAAQESAGRNSEALESFMQVYAMNIDYRDVAGRIRALKGQ
jgi:tetratricopeptide (TPR) repeat protein